MAAETQRSVAEKIGLFRRCFAGLPHVYGTYGPRTGQVRQVKQPVTDSVVLAHLQGRQPYGVYLLVEDHTRAVAVDFDTPDPVPAMAFVAAAHHYGMAAYIERSKSKGHHVWVFFDDAGVLAAKARRVVRHILAEIDHPQTEVFPKHDVLNTHTTYGNFINAPLFGTLVPQGRTVFVYAHDPGKPYPDQWEFLEHVECVPEARLDEIIAVNELDRAEANPALAQPALPESLPTTFGLPPCAQRMLAHGVQQYQRVSCFRLAVHLKRVGLPTDLAATVLSAWTAKNRPVDDKRVITIEEIRAQVNAAYERPYRSYGCEDAFVCMFCSPTCPVRVVRERSMRETAKEAGHRVRPNTALATTQVSYHSNAE